MILLSFDIEEFDAPLEHGVELPFEEQMRTSVEGTRKILACLARHRVKATFFCTANFALHAKDLILDIQKGGHEIASHGFYHSSFETADLRKSKEALEELTGQPVNGFRMARMMPVEEEEIHKAGYLYNSSLNPTCIPGRYNHLGQPRTYFMKDGVLQLLCRRCGVGRDNGSARQGIDEIDNAEVTRAEVLSPLRNAVCLVHSEKRHVHLLHQR